MPTQPLIYTIEASLSLKASFYQTKNPHPKNATLLYLHGGGFLFGSRDDLPQTYLDLFLENGFNVLAFDYPLAPETPLREIIHCLEDAVTWFLAHFQTTLDLSEPDFFLFGRSAGGYLASILTANNYEHQLGLIRFYGYHHFEHPAFTLPNTYYHRFPKVSPLEAQQLIQDHPVADQPLEKRFPLYLSARQYGNWLSYLGPLTEELFLSTTQLTHFPPTFIVHCTDDPDVPIASSRELSKAVSNSEFLELHVAEHDFDREKNPIADDVYQKLRAWLFKTT